MSQFWIDKDKKHNNNRTSYIKNALIIKTYTSLVFHIVPPAPMGKTDALLS